MASRLEKHKSISDSATCSHCNRRYEIPPQHKTIGHTLCPFCNEITIFNYLRHFTREWIEPLCVALVMAILIKRTFMEIYVIPTSSMEPTLHGAGNYPKDGGDKVLVNKTAYAFGNKPQRWDVIVFLAPPKAVEKDVTKFFIKRLVGLPGEKLEIRNGDIFINDKIKRRPGDVLDEHLWPVFTSQTDLWSEHWNFTHGWVQKGHGLAFSSDNKGTAEYTEEITDWIESDDGKWDFSSLVGDIRVTCTCKFNRNTGEFGIAVTENTAVYTGTINWDAKTLSIGKNNTLCTSAPLPPGLTGPVDILFENIDGRIRLKTADCEISWDDTDNLKWDSTTESGAAFYATSTDLVLSDVNLFRDLFYTNISSGVYQIPETGYFALGDNSSESKDSRYWNEVPKENIIGKAIYVVWPIRIWPFSGTPPWPFAERTRAKKIR